MKATALTFAIVALLVFCPPSVAQEANSPPVPETLSTLYACADVQDDGARLRCFDAATARLREAQTGGALVAVERAQIETLERQSFGFNLPSLSNLLPNLNDDGADAERREVELVVERLIQSGPGRVTFVMSDGQQWAQVESQPVRNVRVGDTVRIRRAALGSYLLSSARGGAAHRVRRVE